MLKTYILILFLLMLPLLSSCSNSIGHEDDTIRSHGWGFTIPERSHVELWVENVYQSRVITVLDEEIEAGSHWIFIEMIDSDGKTLPGGLYTNQLRAGSFSKSRTVILSY